MATISEALAIAVEHHRAGRLQDAEQIYWRILQVEPNHADALHLRGVIASQKGQYAVAIAYIGRAIRLQGNAAAFHSNLGGAYYASRRIPEAIACYRRALELMPDYADAHNNLGNALKDQGKLDEAIACYRRALELRSNFAEAHNNLGVAQKDQGDLNEAIACYRRALQLKPNYAEAHNNLGVVLKEQGKLEEAMESCRRALALRPDYADAHNNLGNALEERGQFDDAVACYRRALSLKPDFAEAHSNLGMAFKDQGKLTEAIDCYRQALALKPDYVDAHNNMGTAFKEQGKLEEALACYHRALELKPDYAVVHYSLGNAREEAGELRGAEDCFRTALRYNSGFAFAHHKLAGLLGGKLPERDLAAQRCLLEEGQLTDSQQLFLHFGLAHVLDARGEYAEAVRHLDRGNRLQLSEWRNRGQAYDPNEHESFVARMIAVCTHDFFRRAGGSGLESEVPVFVFGLPRSGTTLIEQILAGHSQVCGAGEVKLTRDTMVELAAGGGDFFDGLRNLDGPALDRFAARHLEKLRGLCPAAMRIIDKMPDNYMAIGLLARLFPRAKFIHCRRDLRDVAVSCWITHFQDVSWANDQHHIASRIHQYQRIMEHWRTVLPAAMLEVDYERTVADLEGVARRLVSWCGLDWEPTCLEFYRAKRQVRTASAVQVRQPVYGTSVGRWKHYEPILAPLFRAIAGRDD